MSHIFLSCFIAASLCLPTLAGGQSSSAKPAITMHTDVNLVVVDVVVTDAQNNPVHGLTAANFTLFEDGRAQMIKNFEEHIAGEAAKLPALPKLDPGTYTNYSSTPTSDALNILLLDKLNTPVKDQSYVRNEVLKYLEESRPGTRTAIFSLTTQLQLLQGFTSDPELLRLALNGKNDTTNISPLLRDPISGDAPAPQSNQLQFRLSLRNRYTLDAFMQLGHYLSGLSGRKNLIWFSDSFPIIILSDGYLENYFSVVDSFEDEFREMTNLLARGQIAVYPINAHGLKAAPMLNASSSWRGYARNSPIINDGLSAYSSQTASENATMLQIAEDTGGEAFFNTNGLQQAIEKAVKAGSNYYTLSYTPTNRGRKGGFRKIQVECARQGLTLAYRRGYYADDSHAPIHRGEPKDLSAVQAPYDVMHAAMRRGSPGPTEILFTANVKPSSADTEPAPAPGNQANPKIAGPYRHYSVLFSVDTSGIDFTVTADGVKHCVLESRIFVYDVDGVLLNTQINQFKVKIPTARFASLLQSGIQFRQEISVPVKGDTFLRIGIHDITTDHVGAVEVPISAIGMMPPLAVQTPAPAFAATPN